MANGADDTGPAERAQGQAYGRVLTVRRGLLRTLEQTLMRVAEEDEMNKIPAFVYDGTNQERVKIQLTVFRSEGA